MLFIFLVVFIIIVVASDVVFGVMEIEAVDCVIVVFLNVIEIKTIVWQMCFPPKQKIKI